MWCIACTLQNEKKPVHVFEFALNLNQNNRDRFEQKEPFGLIGQLLEANKVISDSHGKQNKSFYGYRVVHYT